jgi:putative endopeptidase
VPRHLVPLAVALVACRTASTTPAPQAPRPGGREERAPQSGPGIDPSIIDASVKPCDDFYAYACGGWLKTTEIPPDQSRWQRSFTEIDERNLKLLRAIAEQDAAGRYDPADRYPDKVGDLWAACMDEAGVEARGTADLRDAFERIGEVKDVASLATHVGLLHKDGTFPIFALRSEQDAKDATEVIGVVRQGGLSLPDRDYYLKDDPKTLAIQDAYQQHVRQMFALAGVAPADAAAKAAAIYALERRMAEAHWTRVEMRDPQRTYNRVDLPGLEKAAPRFPWRAYLEAIGHPGLTAFGVTTPQYLERVNELLDSVPPATWRSYLEWRLLAAMAARRALPKRFVDEQFAFTSRSFTGQKELEPRWKHCTRLADGALGEAIGQGFVRRHFGADGKRKTQELVSGIEGAMGRDLDRLGWMDDATRRNAHQKLHAIVNKVGYPDSWRAYDAMRIDRGSFFRSVRAASAFEVNRDLAKIGKPLDRNEWRMSPPMVNAYYDPAMNEIVFPAGILQPPFFTRGAPDAVNYGAIGMVVGHELTHGFDDQGRRFDARGNLTDWWTPAVNEEFDRRARCVVDQYADYVVDPAVPDVKVNGQLTLGENIADLGGLKLAFAAYQASRGGRGPEASVAGFTPEQAFFLAQAQVWCTAIRPENARLRAATDPHAPPRWRVNGPLSNLMEFREAFSCPAGSAMVRAAEKRCEVW